MKNLSYLLFVLFVSILSSSCGKILEPEPCEGLDKGMPGVTTTGANKMGCYINGESWVAYVPFGGLIQLGPPPPEKIDLDYSRLEDGDYVRGRISKIVAHEDCSTKVHDVFSFEIFNLVEGDNSFGKRSRFVSYEAECGYYIDTLAVNEVTILKNDTVNNILSFEFECQFISEECPTDTLIITEGRFDGKY